MKVERCPTLNWKKVDIEEWLEEKDQQYDRMRNKVRLMEIVKRIKPLYNKYVVDEYAKTKNMTILWTPPYHFELNPMEPAWSSVKRYVKANNTTFELPDVKQLLIDGVRQCSAEMWKNFVEHTVEEENGLWSVDLTVDKVMDIDLMITSYTSNSDDDLGCMKLR